MTSTPISGYEPPRDLGEFGTPPITEPDNGSTTEVAKDQAANVGQSAQESGKQVASATAQEATNVADEARRQAKDLGHEFASQAQEQAALQKDKAANGLQSLGDELRSMATQGGQSGPVTDLTHQAADKVTDLATWLEHRDPGTLLDEVRSYARRKPGTFLLGAVVAGVVAGRLTRGAVQARQDDSVNTGNNANNDANGNAGASAETTAMPVSSSATAYVPEPTPIADLTAAHAATNGYEPAGRSL